MHTFSEAFPADNCYLSFCRYLLVLPIVPKYLYCTLESLMKYLSMGHFEIWLGFGSESDRWQVVTGVFTRKMPNKDPNNNL